MTLDQALARAGISRAELADRLNVTPPTVSRYASGERRLTAIRAHEIERILGCARGEIEWPGEALDDEQLADAE